MANRNYVPVIERHLGSEPERIVPGNRLGLIVEYADIAARSSLTNDHPHSLNGSVLLTLHRNFKDQLGKIAQLKGFSSCEVRNKESLGGQSVAFLAVIEAPAILFKIGSPHRRAAFIPAFQRQSLAEVILSMKSGSRGGRPSQRKINPGG
jgi:hypothetical protein